MDTIHFRPIALVAAIFSFVLISTVSRTTVRAQEASPAPAPLASDSLLRSIDRFLAEWRTVSLGRGRPVYINPQDCDLLKGISRQILPHLSVEIVEERFSCDHVSRFPLTPKLVVKALTRTV